jgi:uncharacterized membrane protein
MKESEILVLTKWQKFWHYFIVPFLLLVPVLTTIEVFKYYVTHTYKGIRPIEDMMVGYIFILPAIIFYFIQKKRLKFKIINIAVDEAGFKKSIEQTASELEWNVRKITKDTIVAKSGFSWRSWGEQITIIWDKDRILFNSICDPDNKTSIASYGMNKLNRRIFEQFLRQNVVNDTSCSTSHL